MWLYELSFNVPVIDRYLQNERSGEHAIATQNSKMKAMNSFATPRSELSNNESNYRCSKCLKEVHRDFPCINIILRPDCKIRASQYNHLQKQVTQSENKPVSRQSEDICKRELELSEIQPSDLSNRKYNQTALTTENPFDSTREIGTRCETKFDKTNEELPFNNVLQIPYSNTPISPNCLIHTNETRNIDKALTDPIKRKLIYTKNNEISANQATSLPTETTNTLITNDKTVTNICTNKREIENGDSYKALLWKTVPSTKVENGRENVSECEKVSATLKTDLTSRLEQVEKAKLGSVKMLQTDLKSSRKGRIEFEEELTAFKGADLKSTFTNTFFSSQLTTESPSRYVNHKPYKEHSRIVSLIAPHIDKPLIEDKKIQNITSSNKSIRICTCKHNHGSYTTSTNYAKNISDKNALESRRMEDFSKQRSIDFSGNTNYNPNDYSKSNTGQEKTTANIKFMDTITFDNNLERQKNLCYSMSEQKPVSAVGISLNMIDSTINGVKIFNDKITEKNNFQNDQCRCMKCNTMNCNHKNVKSGVTTSNFSQSFTVPPEFMKPEFMKMLMEIKEHTKILEEQLTIMNKHMKFRKKANEKFISISERDIEPSAHRKGTYTSKQRKDISVQEPEKENVCIQEPSETDITYVKCIQDKLIKSDNNVHRQKVKDQDMTLKQIDKKMVCRVDIQENKSYMEEQQSKPYEKNLNNSDTNNKTETNTSQQIDHKLVKCYNVDSSKKIRSHCVRSAPSFTLNQSNFRPLALSTPKKTNILNDKESLHYISYCIQNIPLSNKPLQKSQVREGAISKVVSYSLKQKEDTIDLLKDESGKQERSTGQEKTIVMLFLTRGVNNTYLKSKYKKLKFTNFKPKCIIDPCITCNQGSIKCRSPRRKAQIPTVLKFLKSAKYKIDKCVDTNQTSRDHLIQRPAKDRKVSNLLTTVCTQSSNLHITTATSVSCVTFDQNYTEDQIATGTCILS